ncbi:MAG: hypothetical protein WCK76_12010 [Elusimicrobiota bacterium]
MRPEENDEGKKIRKTWILLTPIYVVIGGLLAMWVIKLNLHEVNLGPGNTFSWDGSLKKGATQYSPDLADTAYSVRYQSSRQAAHSAAERERQAGERREAEVRARAASEAASRAAAAMAPARTTSAREKAFLAKYDGVISNYQDYLGELGQKFYKKSAAIRKMDSDFVKMGRYMALKEQYEKDRDAYKWARGVMALPEVRSTIFGYLTDPGMILAGAEVLSEALKNPPPAAVYDEMMRFMTTDSQATVLVGEVSRTLVENSGSVMPQLMDSGVDISGLQKLGSQITPGAAR